MRGTETKGTGPIIQFQPEQGNYRLSMGRLLDYRELGLYEGEPAVVMLVQELSKGTYHLVVRYVSIEEDAVRMVDEPKLPGPEFDAELLRAIEWDSPRVQTI